MRAIQQSLIGQGVWTVLLLIYSCYEGSVLCVFVRSVSDTFRKLWRRSLTGRFLSREGAISRGWKHSLLGQMLSVLINLPGLLCRWLYGLGRPVLEGSVAARAGFNLVEEAPLAAAWLMLLFLVIPYESWNNAYSLMGFALLLLFAVLSCSRKSHQRIDTMSIGPYLTAFAGFVFLGWVLSISSMESQRYFMYHLACILCVLVIVSTVERADQLSRLVGMATLGLIAISGYAFVQRIQGVEVNKSYVDIALNKDMPGRVFSFFENPNAFGEVLVLLIPLAVALLFGSRSLFGRLLGLVGAGVGTAALIMTYSRAGWVGLLVAAVVFVFLWKRKLLPVFLALGLAAIPLLPDVVFNRILTIFNMNDTSTSSRFPLYEAAWSLIQQNPFWGSGLGSDAVRLAVKEGNHYHGEAPFVHSHNVYLQIWAELGIFALLSLIASVGWTFKRAAHVALGKIGSHSTRMIVVGGIAAILGIMVCGIADFIWHYPRVMLVFWFVFAVTLAAIRLALREEGQPTGKHRARRSLENMPREGARRAAAETKRNPRRGEMQHERGRQGT